MLTDYFTNPLQELLFRNMRDKIRRIFPLLLEDCIGINTALSRENYREREKNWNDNSNYRELNGRDEWKR